MSKLSDAFKNQKAFIAFITGGDPDIETTEKLLYAMAESGADIIEIGIPFSDPIAEEPVIQRASKRALDAGCTTDKLFDLAERVNPNISTPLVFMTYINPIYTYGKDKFMARCSKAGIKGIIVLDLPFEERDELAPFCEKYNIDLISIITPTSHKRITKIAKEAKGFVYCVSSLGVTEVRSETTTDINAMTNLVKQSTDTPCAIGLGISTPKQVVKMSASSNGVIAGSAIVKIVEQYGKDCVEHVKEYVESIKKAIS